MDYLYDLRSLSLSNNDITEDFVEHSAENIDTWFNLVKEKAKKIIRGSTDSSEENTPVPELIPFLLGKRDKKRKTAVSIPVTQREHLHRSSKDTKKVGVDSTPLNQPAEKAENSVASVVSSAVSGPSSVTAVYSKKKSTASLFATPGPSSTTPVLRSSKRKSMEQMKRDSHKNIYTESQISTHTHPPITQKSSAGKVTKGKKTQVLHKKGANQSVRQESGMSLRQVKIAEKKRKQDEKMESVKRRKAIIDSAKQERVFRKCFNPPPSSTRTETSAVQKPEKLKKAIDRKRERESAEEDKTEKRVKKVPVEKGGIRSNKNERKKSSKKEKECAKTQNITPKVEKKFQPPYLSMEPSTSSASTLSRTLKALNSTYTTRTRSTTPSDRVLRSQTPQKAPIKETGIQSYQITPMRQSSFVSYDISEIKDSDDEEESHKPIPAWASGVRLKNALINQHYKLIDPNTIFGSVCDPPDLNVMLGVNRKHLKRTSSAIWTTPNRP